MAAVEGGLGGQLFVLAKDLARVEDAVKRLDARDGTLQAALDGLDLGALQLAIDHLEERTSGLQTELQGLGPVKTQLDALSKKMKEVVEALEAIAAKPAEEVVKVWNWAFNGMDKKDAADAWDILVNWVRNELEYAYGWVGPPADLFASNNGGGYGSVGNGAPMTASRIPPCWYRHRGAVKELSWLCQEWIKIYETSYGEPNKAGDWHDRYAPGVKRRVIAELSRCAKGHQDDAWDLDQNQPGRPQAIDDDAGLSAYISWDLANRAAPPAPGPVAAK